MKMNDVDFSFQKSSEERQRTQRQKLTPPPLRPNTGEPRWKITGKDAAPPSKWEVVTSPKSGPTIFREVGPPPINGGFTDPKHARSRFKLEVTEASVVAGQHADAGSIIECWATTASESICSGRVKVLEEIRNAF
jgi:hypothetical protein